MSSPAVSPTGIPIFQLEDSLNNVVLSIDQAGVITGKNSIQQTTKFILTSAQLLALRTTPILLIPAPGVGKAIVVEEITYRYVFNSVAYTLNAGTLRLFYGTVANALPLHADVAAGLIDQAANRNIIGVPNLVVAATTDALGLNQGIFAGNNGAANFTLGNGTLNITIAFTTVTP